jgi:hypothetical protein
MTVSVSRAVSLALSDNKTTTSACRAVRHPARGPIATRPGGRWGVILAHSLGGMRHSELAGLVKADRAAAEGLPVPNRLLTPAFRAEHEDLAFLFRQMGTFKHSQ